MIEVKVFGVLIDNYTNSPVMLLKELDGNKTLPIYIGPAEASAIAYALENVKFVRPMTIDLLRLIIEGLEAKVKRVVINALKSDTFYAQLIIENDGKIIAIDARPSDSVGLAVKVNAPIFVAEEVMNAAGTNLSEDEATKLKGLRNYLRNINPEDLGNFKV